MAESAVPTVEELDRLPRWALVAFAARCARRLWTRDERVREPKTSGPGWDAVLLAEQAAAGALPVEVDEAVRAAQALADKEFAEVSDAGDESDWGYQFAAPAQAAAYAASAVHDSPRPTRMALLAADRVYYVHEFRPKVLAGIRRDYEHLRDAAAAENWDDHTPVPPEFFALHSEFEEGALLLFNNEIRSEVDAKLLEYFRRHPNRLYQLDPRQFEEVIAKILSGLGYRVEVTQRTRDGGRDIIAVSSRPVSIKLLVECKRYAQERTVGVAPVQRLHGVCRAEGATKGILATTSRRFSRPAEAFLEKQKWLLEGRAFDGLVEWLNLYQEYRNAKDLGLYGPRPI